jgi:uncharacterized membrane protein
VKRWRTGSKRQAIAENGMPYEWIAPGSPSEEEKAPPMAVLRLWPHRSLPKSGFVAFVGTTAAVAGLPLVLLVGSPVLWVLLPFVLAMLAGIWGALQVSYRTGEVVEELRLWPDRVELARCDPRRPVRSWEANPHWIRTVLHQTGGPVPNYITLSGSGRTVEIGAFLSEEERLELKPELDQAIQRLSQAPCLYQGTGPAPRSARGPDSR